MAQSHAHLTHCHDHTLQLAVGETINAIKIMRGTNYYSLKRSFHWVERRLHQETVVTERFPQIVGFSEGHCCKPF